MEPLPAGVDRAGTPCIARLAHNATRVRQECWITSGVEARGLVFGLPTGLETEVAGSAPGACALHECALQREA